MKIARATKQDLESAVRVTSILESLEQGYMPDCLSESDEEINWFDEDDAPSCQKALKALLEASRKGSLGRVSFGMLALLDPRNELTDPGADTLEAHPKINQAIATGEQLRSVLSGIAELAHGASTGPVVADVLWEIRGIALEHVGEA